MSIRFPTEPKSRSKCTRSALCRRRGWPRFARGSAAIEEAGYNTFLLRSRSIFLDMLTDSGTNAMTDNQLAAMMQSDDAYAGSESFYRLEDAVAEIFGYKYVLPAHQGRAAEHLLAKTFVKPGHIVPMNYHFTTTKAHFDLAGGKVLELYSRRGAEDRKARSRSRATWISDRLRAAIEKAGPENVSFVRMEATTNLIGGQPFSMREPAPGEGADRADGHLPGGGRQPDFRERLLHPPARSRATRTRPSATSSAR